MEITQYIMEMILNCGDNHHVGDKDSLKGPVFLSVCMYIICIVYSSGIIIKKKIDCKYKSVVNKFTLLALDFFFFFF